MNLETSPLDHAAKLLADKDATIGVLRTSLEAEREAHRETRVVLDRVLADAKRLTREVCRLEELVKQLEAAAELPNV